MTTMHGRRTTCFASLKAVSFSLVTMGTLISVVLWCSSRGLSHFTNAQAGNRFPGTRYELNSNRARYTEPDTGMMRLNHVIHINVGRSSPPFGENYHCNDEGSNDGPVPATGGSRLRIGRGALNVKTGLGGWDPSVTRRLAGS